MSYVSFIFCSMEINTVHVFSNYYIKVDIQDFVKSTMQLALLFAQHVCSRKPVLSAQFKYAKLPLKYGCIYKELKETMLNNHVMSHITCLF